MRSADGHEVMPQLVEHGEPRRHLHLYVYLRARVSDGVGAAVPQRAAHGSKTREHVRSQARGEVLPDVSSESAVKPKRMASCLEVVGALRHTVPVWHAPTWHFQMAKRRERRGKQRQTLG